MKQRNILVFLFSAYIVLGANYCTSFGCNLVKPRDQFPQRNACANAKHFVPLQHLQCIYSTKKLAHLKKALYTWLEYILARKEVFLEELGRMYSRNDQLDLRIRRPIGSLDTGIKMRLAIRSVGQIILGITELAKDDKELLRLFLLLKKMPSSWRVKRYFFAEYYNAVAQRRPAVLSKIEDSGLLLLALLRAGMNVDDQRIHRQLRLSSSDIAIALSNYLRDETGRLEFLGKKWNECKGQQYSKRRWIQREIVNALASFQLGLKYLGNLESSGQIHLIKGNLVFFGTLQGSSVRLELISRAAQRLRFAANLVEGVNLASSCGDKIRYIDITPSKIDGRVENSAGWGTGSLYITESMISGLSEKALGYVLAHEAAEQQYTKGFFSRRLGALYIEAFRSSALMDMRLSRRIGGEYGKAGYGHPWDSQREWVAESLSAAVIGQFVSKAALPSIQEVRIISEKRKCSSSGHSR